MRILLLSVAMVATALPVSADTTVNCWERKDCVVFHDGPISAESLTPFKKLAAQRKRVQTLIIQDTPGGDIGTAMEIGRILRKDQSAISIQGKCASACVFLVAGAVQRIGLGDGKLIIHRPYFPKAAGSYADAGRNAERLNGLIAAYLREMNISAALLQAMNNIPSYEGWPMQLTEAAEYGIIESDPVWEETILGQRAEQLGITREELHKRIQLRKLHCDPLPVTDQPAKLNCLKTIGLSR